MTDDQYTFPDYGGIPTSEIDRFFEIKEPESNLCVNVLPNAFQTILSIFEEAVACGDSPNVIKIDQLRKRLKRILYCVGSQIEEQTK